MSVRVNVPVKRDWFLFHVIISLLLMFGFGYLPPFGTITPVGMKILGTFLGVIYGWSTTSLIWPSLFGLISIGYSGALSTSELFKISFGNENVILIMFALTFTTVLEKMGLIKFLSTWAISRKMTYGRPWLFTFCFLFGAFICGMLVNEIASTIIFWQMYYAIAKECGFKPFDKYSFFIILGVAFCAQTLGSSTLPFKISPLIVLGTYSSVTGETIDFFKWICFSIPTCSILVVVYTLIGRFIIKPDISALKNLNEDFFNIEDLILNKKQKVALGFLIVMMVALLLPDILPNHLWIDQVLSQMTKAGVFIILVASLFFVKIDGEPVMDFRSAAQGISWDIVFLFAIVFPMTTLITSDFTGIKPCLVNMFSPVLSGQSPLVFTILILLIAMVISNFAHNAVIAVICINIICSLSNPMGIAALPIVYVLLFTVQLAYLTPAASAPAAMVCGNTEWVKVSERYTSILIILGVLFVACILIALPLANLIL